MKFKILILFWLVGLITAENIAKWAEFKKKHGKKYKDSFDESKRFNVWQSNAKFIERHNLRKAKGLESYQMDLNQFTDLTYEEFIANFTGANLSLSLANLKGVIENRSLSRILKTPAPKAVDYRNSHLVGPIKNQGNCG